jgi:TonB family protein
MAEENPILYTPSDGRQCWTALLPGKSGPTPEEIERYADPSIPDEMPEVLSRSHPHMGATGVAHLSGRVVVSVLVDPTGRVVQACLAESAENELDEVAIASVFDWEFSPGTKGGLPVPVWVNIPFLFEGRP